MPSDPRSGSPARLHRCQAPRSLFASYRLLLFTYANCVCVCLLCFFYRSCVAMLLFSQPLGSAPGALRQAVNYLEERRPLLRRDHDLGPANLPSKTLDSGGFHASAILILRGGTLMSIGNLPEILSQLCCLFICCYLFICLFSQARDNAPKTSASVSACGGPRQSIPEGSLPGLGKRNPNKPYKSTMPTSPSSSSHMLNTWATSRSLPGEVGAGAAASARAAARLAPSASALAFSASDR